MAYKLTSQRKAVLDTIIANMGTHLSAEEIYGIVKVTNPQFGLATVYRTIRIFEELGLFSKLHFVGGCIRYELSEGKEGHHHHHLVCTKCGNIQEVKDDLLVSLEEEIEGTRDFLIKDHISKFYGICGKCHE